ncbi:hypothetical protein BJX68DRAFT_230514 [Aspergillus pseudodeflectus]|uniref:Uncharacterized protein n=1 Tax=Aspergillus pseudodeflectus TaxID=176178 RepID=A0ABR4KVI6_9EURO
MVPLFPLLALALTTPLLTHAQIGYNAETNQFTCPIPGKQYCAVGSLHGSSVISCTSERSAQIKSCCVECVF